MVFIGQNSAGADANAVLAAFDLINRIHTFGNLKFC